MMDDEGCVGINSRLHIAGQRLLFLANPDWLVIELALYQRGALLGIELGGPPIEFSAS
ncbi:MAG: hypothetical protein ABSE22_17190 [Xanthobacteraceae bacterium]|jgi:hypothetical protein